MRYRPLPPTLMCRMSPRRRLSSGNWSARWLRARLRHQRLLPRWSRSTISGVGLAADLVKNLPVAMGQSVEQTLTGCADHTKFLDIVADVEGLGDEG
jgi:hypothetical protein